MKQEGISREKGLKVLSLVISHLSLVIGESLGEWVASCGGKVPLVGG